MEKENLIKSTCKELGLTYKQLGELIGYSEGGIKNALTKGEISEQMTKSLELLLENQKLKGELENIKAIKTLIKDFLKD
ncbi:XRE family transcriptional regulator [Campylobacter sp. FMV-PI01]|uniref:XRE family transcriptional regulator n=1 Tax=Campylobacter portucalensis TaxID=2608384 RepID=A0A6L5WM74_9BACT|nr:XRE family transcriptional regulator [Campylobacter portucalensis]MSN96771.1 XRE family transcriptional regulator [Campylobacter portucalensis]